MAVSSRAEAPRLVSIGKAAELVGVSRSVAYRLAAANALRGLVRLPGVRMLVRRRVLEAWLDGLDSSATGSVEDLRAVREKELLALVVGRELAAHR